MSWQGFDKAPAISKTTAQNMWTGTPFYWYGFYLGGPCYLSGDRDSNNRAISFTASLHSEYKNIGYNLAYIYVGRQDQPYPCNAPTTSNATTLGEQDAQQAAQFASEIGAPALSVIYLDVEGGNLHTTAMVDYVKAWVSYINRATAYWAGIYCSAGSNGSVAQQLYDAVGGRANMWVAQYQCSPGKSYNTSSNYCFTTSCTNTASINNLNLDNTSFSGAYMRQYAGDVYVKYNGECLAVDLNVSRDIDPNKKQFV
ncbi:glycoside hydrolase domain-containing protein [Effusibacillus pohliae]|uniref:glycoside hydrolase domain-containing protein n=1 Tax=Effusibacillus pohliae TaxID=232270 RepID=UPI00037BB8B6|nr:glycoside hydrolase domain-containing protein [Effusibacillus pohliae]